MATQQRIDWSDVKSAAEKLAGNWHDFDSFAWHRAYEIEDADAWMIWYTSSRDAGLLEQSNEKAVNLRLEPFTEGDDPDLVFERHSSWLVGHIDGFSIRVFKPDGSITPAFEEFCRIKEELEGYPVLNESDYSDREFEATLENYQEELWRLRDQLPDGWEGKVFTWFSDNGLDRFIENRDDGAGGHRGRKSSRHWKSWAFIHRKPISLSSWMQQRADLWPVYRMRELNYGTLENRHASKGHPRRRQQILS